MEAATGEGIADMRVKDASEDFESMFKRFLDPKKPGVPLSGQLVLCIMPG